MDCVNQKYDLVEHSHRMESTFYVCTRCKEYLDKKNNKRYVLCDKKIKCTHIKSVQPRHITTCLISIESGVAKCNEWRVARTSENTSISHLPQIYKPLRPVADSLRANHRVDTTNPFCLMSKSAHLVTGPAAAKLAKDVNATLGSEKAQMVVSGSVYLSVFLLCLPHTA